MITVNSPTYYIDRRDRYGSERMTYRYEQIRVVVSTSGYYTFHCNKQDYPYFVLIGTIGLYQNKFDTSNVLKNQLLDYDDGSIHRSTFDVLLQPADYILVISVTKILQSPFSILVVGPANVTFSSIR